MAELALVLCVLAAIVSPHLLPLRRVAPVTGAAIWIGALALRALVVVGAAIFALVYLPQTGVFAAIADWCLHGVLPVLTTHLGLSGHTLADAALILPALALTASALWIGFGMVRAALALRRRLSERYLRKGPLGSTVVAEPGIVVAVTGVGQTRVVISEDALGAFDEAELRASLAHEWAHVRRRHRPVLALGALLASLGRLLPGTRHAQRELGLCLERDADQAAVRATRDPLALASAICKAAQAPALGAVALGGQGQLTARLDHLVDDVPAPSARLRRLAAGLAALSCSLALLLAVSIPAWSLSPAGPTPHVAVDTECHKR